MALPKTLQNHCDFGRAGEAVAADYLRGRGYRILTQNFRTRFGEIDLIAQDGRTLCFVEVKTRRSGRYGTPAEAVSRTKQRKLGRMALCYLKGSQRAVPLRFDVVAIRVVPGEAVQVNLIKNAFEYQPA